MVNNTEKLEVGLEALKRSLDPSMQRILREYASVPNEPSSVANIHGMKDRYGALKVKVVMEAVETVRKGIGCTFDELQIFLRDNLDK
mgnify:CR=1 FL=1